MEPMDLSTISDILTKPPFIDIAGSFNARRIPIPQRAIYRTGSLENVTADGISSVQNLGISKIFDLRSLKERSAFPFPSIPNVDTIWIPSTLEDPTATPAQTTSNNKPDPENPTTYFVNAYLSLLTSHANPITQILTHILASPPDSIFSFNCTAGKDRTGVVAYILLRLADVPLPAIDLDYALTRIGIEPVREFLTQKATGGRPLDMNDPVMRVAASIPFDAMTMLDRAVRERYGREGVRAYVRGELGFSEVEVVKIVNMLGGFTA